MTHTHHFRRTILHCGLAGALLVTAQFLLARSGTGLDELLTTPVARLVVGEEAPDDPGEVDVEPEQDPVAEPDEEPTELEPEPEPDEQPSPQDMAALLALLEMSGGDLEQELGEQLPDLLQEPTGEPEQQDDGDEVQEQLAAMLAQGGALLESGAGIPRLAASFLVSDIEQFVERGLGIVIVEWGGTTYRVVPHGRSFLEAKDLVVLTSRSLEGFSNQTLLLNPPLADGRLDRQLRRRFASLDRTLRQRAGAGAGRPRFELLLGARLARLLHTKQLGALAHAGLTGGAAGSGDIETIGRLMAAPGGPLFLVEAVRVSGRTIPFDDPQRALIAVGGR